jgi:hypothetical protein
MNRADDRNTYKSLQAVEVKRDPHTVFRSNDDMPPNN